MGTYWESAGSDLGRNKGIRYSEAEGCCEKDTQKESDDEREKDKHKKVTMKAAAKKASAKKKAMKVLAKTKKSMKTT